MRFMVLSLLALVVSRGSAGDAPLSANQLRKMSWCELEIIYRQAEAGRMPCGYYPGKSIYCSKARSFTTNLAWKGKHFHDGTMTNQWAVGRKVEARVYVAESWL